MFLMPGSRRHLAYFGNLFCHEFPGTININRVSIAYYLLPTKFLENISYEVASKVSLKMNAVLDGMVRGSIKMTFSKDSDCTCLVFHKQ